MLTGHSDLFPNLLSRSGRDWYDNDLAKEIGCTFPPHELGLLPILLQQQAMHNYVILCQFVEQELRIHHQVLCLRIHLC
jgi:hypothetical protein